MSKFVDKLAGALGFSAAAEEYDEYEDDYEEAEELPVSSNRKVTSYDAFSRKSESSRLESSRSTSSVSRSNYDTGFRPTGTRSMAGNRNNKVLNLHANVQMEVVVASPETFEEAREISQHIKDKKPVIINLEFVEHGIAQRITDFLCGCCCAMDGNIQRIADKIFMIAPDNVDFAGDVDIRETLEAEGGLAFPWGVEE
jgi:cell division inhibitor SepF